ncbi:MAG: hypothetical protein PVH29_07590 [Candidatus Zixiibacteriota bacterium]|jgi:preprotein translocase subunit SecD
MFWKVAIAVVAFAAFACASGLPEEYKPPVEPRVEEPPVVEEPPRIEKPSGESPGAELHDVRVLLYIGGVAPSDKVAAGQKLVPILERRAAGVAKRYALDHNEGESRINVELFGCPDPDRALLILTAPGLLEFQAVAERDAFVEEIVAAGWSTDALLLRDYENVIVVKEGDRAGLAAALRAHLPAGSRVLWSRPLDDEGAEVYEVALATGDGMAVTGAVEAVAVADPATREPVVHFDLNERDGTVFSGLTARNLGGAIAVVFDDELFYTARVQEQTFRRVAITGDLSAGRAKDIALLLSSGSLPATVTPVEYYVDGESRPIPKPSK